MKHFLIAGLLVAIGAVALVGPAHAASKYCIYNPDDPDCYGQGGYDDGGYPPPPPPPPPPPKPRYDDNGYDENDYGDDGPYYQRPPRRPVYRQPSVCGSIGAGLRRYGYRHIRAIDCNGRFFEYIADRGNRRFLVKVNSNTARIVGVRRR